MVPAVAPRAQVIAGSRAPADAAPCRRPAVTASPGSSRQHQGRGGGDRGGRRWPSCRRISSGAGPRRQSSAQRREWWQALPI
ncbi:MAG: hypothetical protein WDW38_006504 [Sanguina aurantia]